MSRHAPLWQYGLAIATVTLAALLALLLWPSIKPEFSPLFFAAVIVSTRYGGLGSGLLATVLAAAAINYFFDLPSNKPVVGLDDLVRLGLFVVVALLISSLTRARTRGKEVLRESELRFRSVAQSANDAIIVADDRGYILYWNEGAHAIFGYDEKDVVGKPLTLLMPARHTEAHASALERLSATGKSTMIGKTVELSGLRKDGSEFPLELSLATWQTTEGPLYSGIIRDRTRRKQAEQMLEKTYADLEKRVKERTTALSQANLELREEIRARKQAEQMLRESEEHFRRAFDYAPIGMALLDLDGRWLQVNRALCQILGYGEQELLAHTVQSTTYPDDLAEDLKQMDQLLAGACPSFQRERRYIHKLGHAIWTLRSVSLVRDAQGKPLHFITQVQNITERKKMEEERQGLLRDLDERIKELTALHHTAQLLQDHEKTTPALLQEIATILRVAWQEPERTAARILFDGMEYTTPNFALTPWKQHVDFTTPSGKHGAVEVVHLKDEPNGAQGPLLPEEKKLLDSLAEMLRLHLERKEAKERADLATRDLIERNKELLKLQQEMGRIEPLAALGRITGAIAHELGTPLNSVLGYTQLLAKEELTESARRRLKTVEVQVRRMADIVQYYLDRTRDSPRRFSRINVNQLISDTLLLIKPLFEQKGVEATLMLAKPLPPLSGHGASLQRVFINLLNNAVDAVAEGGTVKITTRTTTPSERAHPGIIIEITDTGEGIPPDLLPKIFDLFVTTKSPGKGTGLGLAVCQEIVKAHGGHIEIISQLGQGTCVRILLPTGGAADPVPSAEGNT
ncbi:MAG: PAS domain S-box protein [Candidatus Binatia bacterium]